ncbi:ExbD/TolR family protein [Lentisalinibacter orientalis]|uniref:ExbD/TolR family protein n=1 Tax=Lentisalinibacter orientalis TaxID=2992241 RepID=UPI00386C18B5
MNLATRSKEEPEVNLTSLIDVVFLLLIFFMVSTSFVKESRLTITLPEAESEAPAAQTERLEVAITAAGTFLVNGRELVNNSPVTLRRALLEVSGGDTGLPVTIVADADARHQSVVTVMDVAGRMGFVKIDIATVAGED